MRSSHNLWAVFDDPNLVAYGGLAPALALAERAGLADLVTEHLTLTKPGSANAHLKVPALVAGMVAGADSIDDMDLLRHGGMNRLFTGARAPSTLGTFLRTFTFGHVRQLDAVASRFPTGLTTHAPVLAGADQIAYLDIDDTIKATHGYAKQGVGYGYSKVKGLNALIATLSTPVAAPVIVGTRLRRGNTNSARGAAKFVSDAAAVSRSAGASGLLVLRGDSALYGHAVVAAARRAGARFSLTVRMNASVVKAISAIDESAWVPIHYPNAIWDQDEHRLVSDAEVAEIPFTAFTSRKKTEHVTARLIVRRVKRLNPKSVPAGQGELFATYRHHAVFTDSPPTMLEAEAAHRAHAVIEQVHADLRSGPFAHAPSGSFAANGAWLVLAAIAFNLTRAAGVLASDFHAKATTATIRDQLIKIPARMANSARRLTMHLPHSWPWQHAWEALFAMACGPPRRATT
ncbi:IS1380 family transposase [Nocardioides rotundus]|uniref:IS1380 family transposase n=1 Tax=Nocardioides rotundus TaxID=1774216 RepID=UPI001CBEF9C0|nr:IS1380 family transposase [Nocardioides rotundus]UAL28369.1 IS1380 family transposase [Nocardioides rotundus]